MIDRLFHLDPLWSEAEVGRGLELARMRAAAWKARLAPTAHVVRIDRQQRCPDQAGTQRARLKADTSRREIQQRQIRAVPVQDDDPAEAVIGKALAYIDDVVNERVAWHMHCAREIERMYIKAI